jgi:beta-galactosidase
MPDQISIFVKSPVLQFKLPQTGKDPSRWSWPDEVANWNWSGFEGDTLDVNVYSSCDEVELFINGNSAGRMKTNRETRFTARYKIRYQSGTLRAVGYRNGKEVNSAELKTTGEPERIYLASDRKIIKADGQDLCYVTVELQDSRGLRHPTARNLVKFEIKGPAKIIGVGSSDPLGNQSFTKPARKAYQGRCLVIIKAENNPGEILLKASSDGLSPAEAKIFGSASKK